MARYLALAVALGLAALSSAAHAARRVAVVVGVSDVPSLPQGTELPQAATGAQALADFLLKRGGYDSVNTLIDASATRDAVRDLLLSAIPKDLKPGDTLLFAFAGQGFGGDFGDPHLLLFDSQVEKASSALNLYDLTAELAKRLQGVNIILLLDAAHAGAAGGVALLGPTAKSLSALPGTVFVLSASSPGEAAPDGLFFHVVLGGLQGAADSNHDAQVSASELHRYAVNEVGAQSHYKTHPAEAGNYDPNLAVAVISTKGYKARSGDVAAAGPAHAAGKGSAIPFGGPLSYSLIGAGALVAGGMGVYGNLRGHALCDVQDGQALCASDDLAARYSTIRGLTNGAYVFGAVLGAVGVGLGFVPLADQAWIQVGGRF